MSALPGEAERYLTSLERALGPLPAPERAEILEELRSHLADRAAQGTPDLLAGFEAPEAYAAAFVRERALAGALAQGTSWAVGRALLAGAGKLGWWYAVLVLGVLHLYGVTFLALAVAKTFFPSRVGLFVGGGTLAFGAFFGDPVHADGAFEVLGWWAIPLFVALGALILWAANGTLRALGRWRLARMRSGGRR